MSVLGCLRWWALVEDAAARWLSLCHVLEIEGGDTAVGERERVVKRAEERERREMRENSGTRERGFILEMRNVVCGACERGYAK